MRIIYFDEPVRVTIFPALHPSFVRAAQFLEENKSILLQKCDDISILPVMQSPDHAHSIESGEVAKKTPGFAGIGKSLILLGRSKFYNLTKLPIVPLFGQRIQKCCAIG